MSISFLPTFINSQLFRHPQLPQIDCTGKTIVITGANVGLGKEAAKYFLQLNADKIILACRSVKKGEDARADIEKATGRTGHIEVWALDLANYDSIRSFAQCVNKLERVDVFLANAGVMTTEASVVNGHESTIAVNVISTFLLVFLVLPTLQRMHETLKFVPTLSVTASDLHYIAKFPEHKAENIFQALDEVLETGKLGERYPTSKLLQVFLVRELARRNPSNQLHVTVNCLTPGWCHSELMREITNPGAKLVKRMLARTAEVGGRTLVDAASKGPETHGKYLQDCEVRKCASLVEGPRGPEIQRRLFDELVQELESIEPGVTNPYNSSA